MKNTVKINESQLRKVIAKSIKKMLNESNSIENNSYGEDAWDEEEGDWVAQDNSRPAKPVDYGQELQPGFYVCEVGNYGDVQVSTTENLKEVEEALSASESAVFGPYSEEEAFKLAVNEVNNNWGFDFDGEWVRREFNDPADIEYYYSDEKWQEIAPGSQVNESKNTKKNVAKINENTLRKIVAESVKKVLQEIDYKTYLWAAQQAKARGDEDRAQKFSQYARQIFSQEFNDGNGEDTQMYLGGTPGNYGAGFGSNTLGVSPSIDYTNGKVNDGRYKVTQYGSPSYMNRSDMMDTMRNQYPKSAERFSKADNELSDFRNGNYVYNNGWKRK